MIEINRIQKIHDRFGDVFFARILHPSERTNHSVSYLAKRFAAKEALLKSLGLGLSAGLSWHDVVITADAWGKPLAQLSRQGEAIVRKHHGLHLEKIFFHISLSDTKEYAQAMAIFECIL